MRVLLVTHRFPPHHTAGVENYTSDLAQALAKEVTVAVATTLKVISRPMGHLEKSRRDGFDVYTAVNHHVFPDYTSSYADPRMESAFGRILDEFRPDVVHIQHVMYWSTRIAATARARGIRVVATLHDYWTGCSRMGQLIDPDGRLCASPNATICPSCMSRTRWRQSRSAERWIERLTTIRRITGVPLDGVLRRLEALRARRKTVSAGTGLRTSHESAATPEAPSDGIDWPAEYRARRAAFFAWADAVELFLAPSASLARAHAEFGVPTEKIEEVRFGIAGRRFDRRSPPNRPSDRPLAIAFLGQIAPHKGLHVLIDAVCALPENSVRLTIAGSDDHAKDYGASLQKSAPGSVRFVGRLDRAGVDRLLSESDLLCVPSLWNEGAPLVIQEAFVAGCPCLVSDLGGMADLVAPGIGGDRVKVGDVSAWTAAIGRVGNDRTILERWRAAIPEVPEKAAHVAAVLQRYRRLLGGA